MKKTIALVALVFSVSLVADPLKVITSTTDLGWAVKEIGGAHVEVKALLKGTENPHYVDAVPEFIRLASEAQVAVIIGLDLEIGWMPKVLARSGNARVQPGGSGYVEAGKGISVLEKPKGTVDRSMGDVHPAGNPHFWLGPEVFAAAMIPVTQTLSTVDPAHAADYQAGLAKFTQKMKEIQEKNKKRIQPLLAGITGAVMLEYHQEFAYFLEAYGLKSMGSIEEKPGVTPSAGRLADVGMRAKSAKVKFALAADTAPKKTLERFSEISGIPVITVPMSLYPKGGVSDYPTFQDTLVNAVVKGLQGEKT